MIPGKQLCPRCGGILTFRDEYQRWFCYTCHRSLGLLPKKSKRAIALGIIVLVVCSWILPSTVLYIWISGFGPTEEQPPPYCILSASTSGTESGKTRVNVTWMVMSTSRADIKWSDVTQYSAKIVKNGTVMSSGFVWTTWPTGTYVTGGDIIKVTLNRAAAASGSIVKLVLVYAPSGGTFGECSVTVTYTI